MANYITYGSSFTSFTCSVEGLAFIAAHEAATGLPMGDVQKTAVCGFIDRLKGNGTTNNSNIWSLMTAKGSYLFPLTPIDDTTATADAYKLDLVSSTSVGSFINFISSDFTAFGVTGGSTKSFNTGLSTDIWDARGFGFGVYSRTNSRNNSFYEGGNIGGNRCTLALRVNNNTINARVNSGSYATTDTNTDSRGLFYVQSLPIAGGELIKNGSIVLNNIGQGGFGTTSDIFTFHNYMTLYSTRQLSMYFIGMPYLDTNQSLDFYEAVQWYQTNVITGGRNV